MEKKREALCPYFSGAADAQGRAQNLSFLPWEREAFKAGRQTHFLPFWVHFRFQASFGPRYFCREKRKIWLSAPHIEGGERRTQS